MAKTNQKDKRYSIRPILTIFISILQPDQDDSTAPPAAKRRTIISFTEAELQAAMAFTKLVSIQTRVIFILMVVFAEDPLMIVSCLVVLFTDLSLSRNYTLIVDCGSQSVFPIVCLIAAFVVGRSKTD